MCRYNSNKKHQPKAHGTAAAAAAPASPFYAKLKSLPRLTSRVLCSLSSAAEDLHGVHERSPAAGPLLLGVSEQQPKSWGALKSGGPRRYNSNEKHQHEVDDMADAMEPVLFEYGADIVLAGHVHAYERSFRSYRCPRCTAAQTYSCSAEGWAHSESSLSSCASQLTGQVA